MTPSAPLSSSRPERAFLDANVIRGQLTNDLLLSMADRDVFDPRWTQPVLDEMRRNRPPGVTQAKIDRRIGVMNRYFPHAMTTGHEPLEPQMQADPKDRHVLAGAVHSRSDVLVTDNVKDFAPPATGPSAMRVERLSQFLIRKLEETPDRVQAALQDLVTRNQRDPRTLPALIDKMAAQPELRAFARKLNATLPPEQRGAADILTAHQRRSAKGVALEGIADARGAVVSRPTSPPPAVQNPQPTSPDRDHTRDR